MIRAYLLSVTDRTDICHARSITSATTFSRRRRCAASCAPCWPTSPRRACRASIISRSRSIPTRAGRAAVRPRCARNIRRTMTIVLQHQFWDLTVDRRRLRSRAVVRRHHRAARGAVRRRSTGFYDPSVQFGLQFEAIDAARRATRRRRQAANARAQARRRADKPRRDPPANAGRTPSRQDAERRPPAAEAVAEPPRRRTETSRRRRGRAARPIQEEMKTDEADAGGKATTGNPFRSERPPVRPLQDPHRNRHVRPDRSAGRALLGRADRALAA